MPATPGEGLEAQGLAEQQGLEREAPGGRKQLGAPKKAGQLQAVEGRRSRRTPQKKTERGRQPGQQGLRQPRSVGNLQKKACSEDA
mmetsp:Transcript_33958/g.82522  ORF Transcript_33958/g.82522 Transcript_33958/m.82522 type:complete len:86 (+) Transcript_33958:1601-1858(+)